ncbi:NAD(P)-binding domain-containing protein [Pseudaeromonas sp. ZJS20]|uniref:lactate/malate family dehydrogenase n=1 Tax=Pseudaeromonas aegiceratis TaxID=3153928 RepID=UPI00390C5B5C
MGLVRIGIIGTGHVGSHVASGLLSRGVGDELILLDSDRPKAERQAQDLADAAAFAARPVRIRAGDYQDLQTADLVVVCASGPLFKADRLEELADNLAIMRQVAAGLNALDYRGLLLAITNPCDVLAWFLAQQTRARVIGTGTLLDSARFRSALARQTGVAPQHIQAYCLGEHGDSQVLAWSAVSLMGLPLAHLAEQWPARFGRLDRVAITRQVVKAGWDIVQGKGSTEFGIGAATAELAQALLGDEQRILPCSVPLTGQYGQTSVFASLPCLLGRQGVEAIVPLPLSAAETSALAASCQRLRHYQQQCG